MEGAPHEVVELLVVAAEFDVGLEGDGVGALHERVHEFVHRDRLVGDPSFGKVVALHDARDGHLAAESEPVGGVHLAEPLGVEADLGLLYVEDFAELLFDGLDVLEDFFLGELLARLALSAGVADHRREVADDEDGLVPEALEVAKFAQNDCPAERHVARRGIDAEFDAQWLAALDLLGEGLFADDLRRGTTEDVHLLVDSHSRKRVYRRSLVELELGRPEDQARDGVERGLDVSGGQRPARVVLGRFVQDLDLFLRKVGVEY